MERKRNQSVTMTVIKAFIPYTKENGLLVTSPNAFYDRLEYLDRLAKQADTDKRTISSTISRAKKSGLLKFDNDKYLRTTWRGRVKTGVGVQEKLKNYLVIAFDLPEKTHRKERDLLRSYLQINQCQMIQRSVWVARYDIEDELKEAIADMDIEKYVTIFIADKVNN